MIPLYVVDRNPGWKSVVIAAHAAMAGMANIPGTYSDENSLPYGSIMSVEARLRYDDGYYNVSSSSIGSKKAWCAQTYRIFEDLNSYVHAKLTRTEDYRLQTILPENPYNNPYIGICQTNDTGSSGLIRSHLGCTADNDPACRQAVWNCANYILNKRYCYYRDTITGLSPVSSMNCPQTASPGEWIEIQEALWRYISSGFRPGIYPKDFMDSTKSNNHCLNLPAVRAVVGDALADQCWDFQPKPGQTRAVVVDFTYINGVLHERNQDLFLESELGVTTPREETAWGAGTRFTEQGNWGTYFHYEF